MLVPRGFRHIPADYIITKYVVWSGAIGAGVAYFVALAYLMRRAVRRGTLPVPWSEVAVRIWSIVHPEGD
jgi:hypothetical protein